MRIDRKKCGCRDYIPIPDSMPPRTMESNCFECRFACPNRAILFDGWDMVVQKDVCRDCGTCLGVCKNNAISLDKAE